MKHSKGTQVELVRIKHVEAVWSKRIIRMLEDMRLGRCRKAPEDRRETGSNPNDGLVDAGIEVVNAVEKFRAGIQGA